MDKMDDDRYTRGIEKLKEVSGDSGEAIVNALGDLGRYIVEFAYGDIYNRPGLSLREREIATVAALVVMAGREPQLRIHLQAALQQGLSIRELEEVIIHTVPYAGFPTAINALNILKSLES